MKLFRKVKTDAGLAEIKFLGLTVFRYHRYNNTRKLRRIYGVGNVIDVPEKRSIEIRIEGNNNKITVDKNLEVERRIKIHIYGDNNTVNIAQIKGKIDLHIGAEARLSVKNCSVDIGESSFSDWCKIVLLENGSRFELGDDCMFSSNILIRCSDAHTVLSPDGKVLNRATSVKIGNHVWCGQDVLISKNTEIPDGCIIGARAVVTKKFTKPNCVLAGVPARVTKEDIRWSRLPPDRIDTETRQ